MFSLHQDFYDTERLVQLSARVAILCQVVMHLRRWLHDCVTLAGWHDYDLRGILGVNYGYTSSPIRIFRK